MTRRIALLTSLLVLALAVPANAQQNPFGPLPSADTPVPTATPVSTSTDNETGSRTLYIIGGALIIGFGIMGYLIMRDARKTVPEIELEHDIHREEAIHKRQKQDKAKARKRTRAQKHARKAQRPR